MGTLMGLFKHDDHSSDELLAWLFLIGILLL